MKRLIKFFSWIIILPFLALIFKILVNRDPGIIIISGKIFHKDDPFGFLAKDYPFTYTFTITESIFYLIVALALTYLVVRLWVNIVHIPMNIANFLQKRQQKSSAKYFIKGEMALLENKGELAQELFLSAVKASKTPSLCYIGAARAAVLQGSANRRDEYLARIDLEDDKENKLLANIYRVEILCEASQFDRASHILESMRLDAPNNPKVLEFAAKIYLNQSQFDTLYQIMPNLHRALSKDVRELIELPYWRALLKNALSRNDLTLLKDIYNNIHKELRLNTEITIDFSTYLMDLDHAEEAENILYQALKKNWNDHLITAYGHIYRGDFKKIIKHAQEFAQSHQTSDYANIAVARILVRMENYTEAQVYIEKALKIKITPDALELFAKIKESTGDAASSLLAYKEATRLLSNQHVPIPQQGADFLYLISQSSSDFLETTPILTEVIEETIEEVLEEAKTISTDDVSKST
ncbi:heme biosynthesis protein HemY [Gammaproteobacteria bacterium]|nr:heme biosynthesis protein HemY [Gammaproteobacteria bacterium]